VRREQPLLDLAHVIAHEFGHAYDQNYNDDRIRNEWKAARGFPNQPGWLDDHANKGPQPHGRLCPARLSSE